MMINNKDETQNWFNSNKFDFADFILQCICDKRSMIKTMALYKKIKLNNRNYINFDLCILKIE